MNREMILKVLIALLFSLNAKADEYLRLGFITNQLHILGDQALTISSGIDEEKLKRKPSIHLVDLDSFRVSTETELSQGLNIFRAAIEDDRIWLSELGQNSLFRLSMSKDLKRSFISPHPFFSNGRSPRGMESVLRVNGRTWVAYTNWSFKGFGDGEILVLDGNKVVQRLVTETPNPKNMIFQDGKVFISIGDYGFDVLGQVLVLDPKKLPYDGSQIVLSKRGTRYHKAYNFDGVPGALFFTGQELFVCDLEYGTSRIEKGRKYFRVNLQKGSVKSFKGRFNSCGSILVDGSKVYVLNLTGGGNGSEDEHLYVYDRSTGRELCSKVFLPGKVRKPMQFFPNEVKKYKNNLIVTIGGFYVGNVAFPGILGKLPLKNGLPKDCN